MLLNKVGLLESQTQHYKELVTNYEKNDSLKEDIIVANREYYDSVVNSLNERLKKETRNKRIFQVGVVGTVVALVWSLLK